MTARASTTPADLSDAVSAERLLRVRFKAAEYVFLGRQRPGEKTPRLEDGGVLMPAERFLSNSLTDSLCLYSDGTVVQRAKVLGDRRDIAILGDVIVQWNPAKDRYTVVAHRTRARVNFWLPPSKKA